MILFINTILGVFNRESPENYLPHSYTPVACLLTMSFAACSRAHSSMLAHWILYICPVAIQLPNKRKTTFRMLCSTMFCIPGRDDDGGGYTMIWWRQTRNDEVIEHTKSWLHIKMMVVRVCVCVHLCAALMEYTYSCMDFSVRSRLIQLSSMQFNF